MVSKKSFYKLLISILFILLSSNDVYCYQEKKDSLDYFENDLSSEICNKAVNPNKYSSEIHKNYILKKNIKYGEAKGFYTSKTLNQSDNFDFSLIAKEVLNILGKTLKKPDNLPLYMDIYAPNKNNKIKKPILLFIHGGGFFLGDKNNKLQEVLTDHLIENDFAVASINYRLGASLWNFNDIKKAIYRAVQDVRSALRYITEYADELNIDTDKIYLAGSSSGGIIALMTAFMEEDNVFKCCDSKGFKNRFGGLDDSGNAINSEFKIAGIISLWGSVTDLSIIDEHKNIPTLLFHGTEDNILYNDRGTPFYEHLGKNFIKKFFRSEVLFGSKSIYKQLTSYNIPARYVEFEGYNHAPHVEKDGSFNKNIDIIKREIIDFMNSDRPIYSSEIH